jgi:threonine dehydrogenase-like Zn-dependent dehydrogenase
MTILHTRYAFLWKVSDFDSYRNLLELATKVGADDGILIDEKFLCSLHNNYSSEYRYDIVFDTTGTSSGFQLALQLAKRSTFFCLSNIQTFKIQRFKHFVNV